MRSEREWGGVEAASSKAVGEDDADGIPAGSRAVRFRPVDRGGVERAAAFRGDGRSGVVGGLR